ncbi:MAG: hypothetical protein WA081_22980 [Desulfosalsimonadaceae bacterium]
MNKIKAAGVVFFAIFLLGGCAGFERKVFDWGVSVELWIYPV